MYVYVCVYVYTYTLSLFLEILALLRKNVDDFICKIEIVAEVSLAIVFFSFFL
jgi:hypothetical protein